MAITEGTEDTLVTANPFCHAHLRSACLCGDADVEVVTWVVPQRKAVTQHQLAIGLPGAVVVVQHIALQGGPAATAVQNLCLVASAVSIPITCHQH